MSHVVGWMLVVMLSGVPDGGLTDGGVPEPSAADGGIAELAPESQRTQAQEEFDAAVKRRATGEYAAARTHAEQALALREAEFGAESPAFADALDLLGDIHRAQGELPQAEPLLQRARGLRESLLGKSHPSVALSQHHLALLYLAQARYDRVEALLLKVISFREAALGKDHPDVAASVQALGDLYVAQGLPARAEPHLQRALDLREAALGESHPDVALSLNGLAALYTDGGRYDDAEAFYERASGLLKAAFGQSHPDLAVSLLGLANLRAAHGQYDKAQPLVQQAITLRELSLGSRHPLYAQALHRLATLYLAQGMYSLAQPLVLRALDIQKAALGEEHPEVAASLHDLATLASAQGRYSQAQQLYERALALREKALGKQHPAYATSLHALGTFHLGQGLYSLAEPRLKEALALREKILGENHPDVATSLHHLATLYSAQRRYAQAESLFTRALRIQEETLGEQHPDVATSIHDLATLLASQGMYDLAQPIYERALEFRLAALGEGHLQVATSRHALATLYLNQGLYDLAEPLLLRALAVREEVLGKRHPDVATVLGDLARLRLGQRRLADAQPLYAQSFSLFEQRLRQEALDFSESRLDTFLRQLRASEETLYALLRAHPEDPEVRRLALSAVLLLKGRSVEETAHISRTLYRSLSAEDRDQIEQLRGLRAELAARSLAGPGSQTSEEYQEALRKLTDEGDALEADIARRSAPLRALNTLPPPAEVVQRVAESLPKDGALVEFIAYEDSPLVLPSGTPLTTRTRQLRYLALVLFPDASTKAVDLGPAESIDTGAAHLRDALGHSNPAVQAIAHGLYKLAFEPLLPLLGSTRHLLLSPEGQLGLVPFAALHDGQGFLVDGFDFTYLTSGRELLPRAQASTPSSFVFVFANPDFSTSSELAAVRSSPSPAAASTDVLERFFPWSRAFLPPGGFAPLLGTQREAEAIQRLLPQAQLFLGADATKERLLHLPTPGILHLATHGYFLNGGGVASDTRTLDLSSGATETEFELSQLMPLLRSGLVLAGAQAKDPGDAPPTAASILVTALELAGLDLWGTQLVVLSSCDTGRGEVRLGQGIYGLRRALAVAGAETVVMSLWSVNDDATRLLMEAYYRNLLGGQGRASALRQAMLELRAARPHPYYWAPFIALGSEAPLRGIVPGEAPRAVARPTP